MNESNTYYMANEIGSIKFVSPKYRCPVCGNVSGGESHRGPDVIWVSLEPYAGKYCLKCCAKWISENFPRVDEIK